MNPHGKKLQVLWADDFVKGVKFDELDTEMMAIKELRMGPNLGDTVVDHKKGIEATLLTLLPSGVRLSIRSIADVKRDTESDSDSETDSDLEEQFLAPTSWKRLLNTPPLPAELLVRIKDAVRDADIDMEEMPSTFYVFVERVARVYLKRRTAKKDSIHANRDTEVFYSVKYILKQIPKRERLYGGSVMACHQVLLPVLEILFEMSEAGPARGSEEWIAEMKDNLMLVTFQDMVDFPVLMRAFVRDEIRKLDEKGLLRLKPGEKIPTGQYDAKNVSTKLVHRETRRLMEVCSVYIRTDL